MVRGHHWHSQSAAHSAHAVILVAVVVYGWWDQKLRELPGLVSIAPRQPEPLLQPGSICLVKHARRCGGLPRAARSVSAPSQRQKAGQS